MVSLVLSPCSFDDISDSIIELSNIKQMSCNDATMCLSHQTSQTDNGTA